MIQNKIIIGGTPCDEDPALRPPSLREFTGQEGIKKQLAIAISSAKKRGQALGHVLLYGPPGLGKTTLAQIVANEMETNFRSLTASVIQHQGEVMQMLVALKEHDVLFIDEVHMLPKAIYETLLGPMEDFILNVPVPDSVPVALSLARFTFVAATTRSGVLPQPFKDRFDQELILELYNDSELSQIVDRSSRLMGIPLETGVNLEIAKRARGTPRLANRLLRRVRDCVVAADKTIADHASSVEAFDMLGVDAQGLVARDRRYLELLAARFPKAVGLKTIANTLKEDAHTVEEDIEPWLLYKGLIEKTVKGRILGVKAPDLGRHLLF
jgi:holliday junction DNA helicase RuvB